MFLLMHAYILLAGTAEEMWQFRMNSENGILERWEFTMLLASFALLAVPVVRKYLPIHLIRALVCLHMAIDGRFQLHAAMGPFLPPGQADSGEFLCMAAIGGGSLLALKGAVRLHQARSTRN